MRSTSYGQQGISMVEIMVALALSLVLTLGVSQIYLASKQSYRLLEAQSRLQENGRYAMEILAEDLREIGYMGCRSLPTYPSENFFAVITSSPPVSSTGSSVGSTPIGPQVTGYDGSSGNLLPELTDGQVQPGWPVAPTSVTSGTDVINIQFAQSCGGQLQESALAGTATVKIPSTNSCSISPTNPSANALVMADCAHVEIFRASAISSSQNQPAVLTLNSTVNPAGLNGGLAFNHGISAEVMVFNSHTYYISTSNNSEISLFRRDNINGSSAQALVGGIEDMEITYGLDTDGDGSTNLYVSADQVSNLGNWSQVIAVHIDLLMVSSGDEGTNVSTQSVNPCTGTALSTSQIADHRLRKCFSSTINLRNPLG